MSFLTALDVRDDKGEVIFACTPDIAVESAYLISTAEGCVIHGCEQSAILNALWAYLDGRTSAQEAVDELCSLERQGSTSFAAMGAPVS